MKYTVGSIIGFTPMPGLAHFSQQLPDGTRETWTERIIGLANHVSWTGDNRDPDEADLMETELEPVLLSSLVSPRPITARGYLQDFEQDRSKQHYTELTKIELFDGRETDGGTHE